MVVLLSDGQHSFPSLFPCLSLVSLVSLVSLLSLSPLVSSLLFSPLSFVLALIGQS